MTEQTSTTQVQLLQCLSALAQARYELEGLEIVLELSKKELLATWKEEYASSLARVAELQGETIDAEQAARLLTVARYGETRDKHVAPGAGIRDTKLVLYTDEEAIAWAVENRKLQFLKLDKAQFESHAKAVATTDPLPMCKFESVPTATISKQLDAEAIDALLQVELKGHPLEAEGETTHETNNGREKGNGV